MSSSTPGGQRGGSPTAAKSETETSDISATSNVTLAVRDTSTAAPSDIAATSAVTPAAAETSDAAPSAADTPAPAKPTDGLGEEQPTSGSVNLSIVKEAIFAEPLCDEITVEIRDGKLNLEDISDKLKNHHVARLLAQTTDVSIDIATERGSSVRFKDRGTYQLLAIRKLPTSQKSIAFSSADLDDVQRDFKIRVATDAETKKARDTLETDANANQDNLQVHFKTYLSMILREQADSQFVGDYTNKSKGTHLFQYKGRLDYSISFSVLGKQRKVMPWKIIIEAKKPESISKGLAQVLAQAASELHKSCVYLPEELRINEKVFFVLTDSCNWQFYQLERIANELQTCPNRMARSQEAARQGRRRAKPQALQVGLASTKAVPGESATRREAPESSVVPDIDNKDYGADVPETTNSESYVPEAIAQEVLQVDSDSFLELHQDILRLLFFAARGPRVYIPLEKNMPTG
ncbi:hypothetical protein HK105_207328 [Polyrhizophydium stewartii]|uniref:Uncharacterized protein n=1 Tax=Polyrhizophydium stewartii TaxID=2732419 RepID=A0ABR4N113_9FUNG